MTPGGPPKFSGGSGVQPRTDADWSAVWRYLNNLYLAFKKAVGINQLTGDVLAGPGFGVVPAVIPPTGVTIGVYGGSTLSAQITINAKGQITSATNVPISSGGGGNQTPWLSDIDGAGFALTNTKSITVNPGALPATVAGKLASDTNGNLAWSEVGAWRNIWHVVQGGVGYLNSWADVGGSFETGAYQKDAEGFVTLRGTVHSGILDPIFTLPVGYRPPKDLPFVVSSDNGAPILGTAFVLANGNVEYRGGSVNQFNLNGIRFATF